jgi:hypothetical protein
LCLDVCSQREREELECSIQSNDQFKISCTTDKEMQLEHFIQHLKRTSLPLKVSISAMANGKLRFPHTCSRKPYFLIQTNFVCSCVRFSAEPGLQMITHIPHLRNNISTFCTQIFSPTISTRELSPPSPINAARSLACSLLVCVCEIQNHL